MNESGKTLIKLVIADDHEIFRDGLRNLLLKTDCFSICGEATNGEELVYIVKHTNPDVILTDISMPEMDGIQATSILHTAFPGIGIIALSMHGEDDFIIEMLEAGAKGYLLKNASKEEIYDAIFSVYQGEPYYCKTITRNLTQLIAAGNFNPHKQTKPAVLNEREKEIIRLIADGYTNKEIAQKIYLSNRTVEGLRLKIMEKLDLKNIAGLIIYAFKTGLLQSKNYGAGL